MRWTTLRFPAIAVALITAGLVIGTPVEAQLRFTASDVGECASLADRAAQSIFLRKKLRLDQRFWSDREKRVQDENLVYRGRLTDLQRAQTQDRADIEKRCRLHFTLGRARTPFLFEWAE